MTERGRSALVQDAQVLTLGPSHLRWDGTTLVFTIREMGVPVPRPIRGEVRVSPAALTGFAASLEDKGRHRWRPMAPLAHVEVMLTQPDLSWSGRGYLDSNDGDTPLETSFRRWDWSRAALPGDDTAIFYDTVPKAGDPATIAVLVRPDGVVSSLAPPPEVTLPRSGWRLPRTTRAEDRAARVLRTLTDAPFYARSLLETRLQGHPTQAMHESVDLDRFAALGTQLMLPFRMPRPPAWMSRRAAASPAGEA
ncbi:carotenoid 1,2-hydratase [Acidisoma sp. 7E03]